MNDLLLDETGDLLIVNGDFVIDDATYQHQDAILHNQKGEFKEHPEVGVGIENGLLDENPREVLSEIKQQFKYNGFVNVQLDIDNDGNLLIEAPYPKS